MKRYSVFAIKDGKDGKSSVWTRAGRCNENKDGSFNIYLDVLPLEGRLHVREAPEKRDSPPEETSRYAEAQESAVQAVGAHQ